MEIKLGINPENATYKIEGLTFEELLGIYDCIDLKLKIMDLQLQHAASHARETNNNDQSYIQLHSKIEKRFKNAKLKVHQAFSNPMEAVKN